MSDSMPDCPVDIQPFDPEAMYLGERTDGAFTLHLWDTGKFDSMGKSNLAYMLTHNGRELLAGKDYHPSPIIAIDSDDAFGGLIGFFSYDAERVRDRGDDAFDNDDYSDGHKAQMLAHADLFADEADELALWAMELEGESLT